MSSTEQDPPNTLRELAARFETASQRYAALYGVERDEDWFLLKLQEELGELTQAWIKRTARGRPDPTANAETHQRKLEDETADLFGHVLLFAHRHELDLNAAIERKWRFKP
jgi:NTP pyrophosphatase (non-canonical NTP hydrolase)